MTIHGSRLKPFCECGCGERLPHGLHWRRNRFIDGHQYRMGTINAVSRFWSKVKPPLGIGECWIWLGTDAGNGYGVFFYQHKNIQAHRFAYECLIGKIPDGLQIDHLCRNRKCVNPYHLEPVTTRENLLRGETIAARNARKKYCAKGHLLAGNNLVRYNLKEGRRACRLCYNEYMRRYRVLQSS